MCLNSLVQIKIGICTKGRSQELVQEYHPTTWPCQIDHVSDLNNSQKFWKEFLFEGATALLYQRIEETINMPNSL
jgi:hypothetical protein